MTRTVLLMSSTALAVLLACGMGLIGAEESAKAAFPGEDGNIAFQSDRHVASGEIYSITPGETASRITVSNGSSDPAYSPDGSRIAFVSTDNQIFVMNADGSGRRQVTTSATAKSQPTWSADGSRIAYVSNSFDVDGQTDLEIWSINADGSGRTQLTNNTFPDTQPAWSPLGDKIAFVSTRTGETNRNVYVMDANGSNQVSVTPNSPSGCSPNCYQGHDDNPSWSPDGSKIAYVHGYGPPENPFAAGGSPNIWVMDSNPATNDWTNLSNSNSRTDIEPAWSPQGDKIAYVGLSDTSRNIYVMDSTGSGQAPIDADLADDRNPDWQPTPICTKTVNINNDPLIGTASNDVLCGDSRNNTVNGAGGNDIVLGKGGNDKLTGSGGNDTINGGPGADIALYPGSTPVRATLTTGFATGVGSDVFIGVENLTGSNASDQLKGSSVANVLVGGEGADSLVGFGGTDTLKSKDGKSGNDSLNGGPGTDKCITDAKEKSIKSCP